MSFFNKIWVWMKAFGADFWDFAGDGLTAIAKELGKSGQALVMEAVIAAEKTDKKGKDKAGFALDYVQNRLPSIGKNALESTINLAIELAVKKLTK